MTQKNRKKVVVLGTGGTIAGRAASASDNVGYTAAQVGVEQILLGISGLQEGPCEVIAMQVAQVDSKDMSFAVWQQLLSHVQSHLADPQVQGVVITHGTDTLEETAYFLHAVLRAEKPVVLTCAMRPATSITPDGPQNVLDAVALASSPAARGVMVVCAGVIHSAVEVQKVHTYRVDAFSSGDAGPLGYIEEGQLRLIRNWPFNQYGIEDIAIKNIASRKKWPRVEIVMNHTAADGAIVRALLNQSTNATDGLDGPVQGLVVAATGNGTLHHDLEDALLAAQSRGIAVIRASRCAMGRVIASPGARLPDSAGLSPVKARIALMLKLMTPVG